jgi:glutathione peroxidase
MPNKFSFFLIVVLFSTFLMAQDNKNTEVKGGETVKDYISDISVKDIDGNEVNLSAYEGKVLLIVNVASECGYTPQYGGLQKIYEKYQDQGLEILAFPCNDFGGQEPGSNQEIKEFCNANYGVTFQLFDKIKVLGEEKSPLYERLINSPTVENGDIKWNFEKFLISKEGKIVERFRSAVKPTSKELILALEKELNK